MGIYIKQIRFVKLEVNIIFYDVINDVARNPIFIIDTPSLHRCNWNTKYGLIYMVENVICYIFVLFCHSRQSVAFTSTEPDVLFKVAYATCWFIDLILAISVLCRQNVQSYEHFNMLLSKYYTWQEWISFYKNKSSFLNIKTIYDYDSQIL